MLLKLLKVTYFLWLQQRLLTNSGWNWQVIVFNGQTAVAVGLLCQVISFSTGPGRLSETNPTQKFHRSMYDDYHRANPWIFRRAICWNQRNCVLVLKSQTTLEKRSNFIIRLMNVLRYSWLWIKAAVWDVIPLILTRYLFTQSTSSLVQCRRKRMNHTSKIEVSRYWRFFR